MFGTMLKPRAEAIWDGELVDVSALAQTQGWGCPVVLTRAAHAHVMEGADEGDDGAQGRCRLRVVAARARRKALLTQAFGRLLTAVPYKFRAELSAEPDARKVVLAVVLTLGEDGPVATITLPGE